MRQKNLPNPRSPLAPKRLYESPPPPPPPPKPPTRWNKFKTRVKIVRDRSRGVLLVVLGMLITFGAMFAYDALRVGSPRLTENDVNKLVASAMASATPPLAYGSQVFQVIAPSIVYIRTSSLTTEGKKETGAGTGVIIDDNGSILTSLHVVTQSIDIQVVFFDNTEAQASIIAQDPSQDIALLRPRGLPSVLIPAVLGGGADVGDEVFAVGSPFGLRHSLSAGVVSALGRGYRSPKTGQVMSDLIQFDAAVNPGNSGGPLLNRYGEVIGIVTSLLNPTDEDVFIGIGFAVPIQTAGGVGRQLPY